MLLQDLFFCFLITTLMTVEIPTSLQEDNFRIFSVPGMKRVLLKVELIT